MKISTKKVLGKIRESEINTIAVAMLVLALVVSVAGILFYLTGKMEKSGANPESEASDAVVCKSNSVEYPYMDKKLDEISHELVINVVFTRGELNIISLTYDMQYASEQRANEAFQMLNSEVDIMMKQAGVSGSFSTNTKVMRGDDYVRLNLYAQRGDISANAAKFLLIDAGGVEDGSSFYKNNLIDNYEKTGLECGI